MKKLCCALFAICALFTTKGFADDDNQKEPFLTRNFPVASVNKVYATTSGGSLSVTGNAANDAVVEVYVTPNNGKSWTKEKIEKVLLDNYVIEIKLENGQLNAVAKRINDRSWSSDTGLSISFKISTRREINTDLKTSGGSVSLNNLSGTLDFSTSGGSLRAENVAGKITGRTSGGSIHVSGSKDQIDLGTSGGSITAEDCTGNIMLRTSGGSMKLIKLSGTVNAKTSGGSIKMNDLDGNVEAKTSGGSVTANTVSGTLLTSTSGGSMHLTSISGNLEAYTSAGSMTVAMKSVKDYVRLSNSGNVSLSLPAGKGYNLKLNASKIEIPGGMKDFNGKFETKKVEGAIAGGGAEISVSSSQRATIVFE